MAACAPFVLSHVPDARANEHESAVPVGEAADHAGAAADLPVQLLDHVARADAPAVPVRELVQQVGRRLADALAQAVRRGLQPPAFHLPGDFPGPGGQAPLVMAGPVPFRSPVRSYLAAPVISSASASSIALRICAIFSVISRSSLVSSRFWSICMMFECLGSVSWLPIAVFCFGE